MNEKIKAIIPMPLQICIDDVGWWSGTDGHQKNEPYRTGINRRHCFEDYLAIHELGKKLGMRPQAGLILAEWDIKNTLKQVPSATWMGKHWKCPPIPLKEAEKIIALFNETKYIEPVLHGVCHEYWKNGKMSRAEWYDTSGKMREYDDVIKHIEAFFKIYEYNGFKAKIESFIPTAFLYEFGNPKGLSSVLCRFGIKYVSTPFSSLFTHRTTETNYLGFENKTILINRGRDLFRWYEISRTPSGKIDGAVCGMHWPNILHINPSQNMEIVDEWVRFIKQQTDNMERIIASDIASFCSQLSYQQLAQITSNNDKIIFDFSNLLIDNFFHIDKGFYIKIYSQTPITVSSQDLIVEAQEKANSGMAVYKIYRKTKTQKMGTILCKCRQKS